LFTVSVKTCYVSSIEWNNILSNWYYVMQEKKELSFVASSLFSRDFSVDWTRSERSREWNINNLDMTVILIVAASLTDECNKIVLNKI